MDFIDFIKTQPPVDNWTTVEQMKLLDDLSDHFGWRDSYIGNTTKKAFVDRKLTQKIKAWVHRVRKIRAMETVTYDEIDLDE
jgi:hypothetical protein